MTNDRQRPRFLLTLEPLPGVDPIKALRWALKGLLRRAGMRCIDIREVKPKRRKRLPWLR